MGKPNIVNLYYALLDSGSQTWELESSNVAIPAEVKHLSKRRKRKKV